MKFKILRRHIEAGKRYDCNACPAAICLQETLKDPHFTVEDDYIKHAKQPKVIIPMPENLREWTRKFDTEFRRTLDDYIKDVCQDHDADDTDIDYIKTHLMLPEIEFEISLKGYVSPLLASVFHPESGLPLLEHYEEKKDEFYDELLRKWRAGEITEQEYDDTFDPKSSHFLRWPIVRETT